MHIRFKQIDKCFEKWGERISISTVMMRQIVGMPLKGLIVVPNEKIAEYEQNGWEISI